MKNILYQESIVEIKHLFRIMRNTILTLFIFAGTAFASESYSQTMKVTILADNISTGKVINEIEKQTDYLFVYNVNEVNLQRKVKVNVQNKPVAEVLNKVFEGTDIYYAMESKNIMLMSKGKGEEAPQQVNKVTGIVKDVDGEPIIGANVTVKGRSIGTVTDIDGHFVLDAPTGALLLVSYIGYTSQEVNMNGKKEIMITLEEDMEALDEVVVIGYGIVKKRDLTGSVGRVKTDEIQKMPVSTIEQALQGRVSGVQITTATGAPGAGATVRIRGGNSISSGNDPLYVIDGIIGAGNLNSLNPSDISSIEILKDASSTAIYGSRGANGVVLITTKRGNESKGASISYNGYYGIQTPVKKLDLLDGQETAIYQNEYSDYFGTPHNFSDVGNVANTDWQEHIFRDTAPITDHNLTVSNGTKDHNYFLSLNYFNQEGVMYDTGYERYQIRFNMDQKIGKFLKIGATMTASYTNKDNPKIEKGVELLPTAPVYNEDGSYYSVNQVSGNTYDNPVALREGLINNQYQFRGLGNIYGQLTLFKNLIIKSSWGFNVSYSKHNQYESVNLPSSIQKQKGGQASVDTSFPLTYQNENTINYSLDLGKHSIGLLGGFTWQKYMIESLTSSTQGFKNDANDYHSMQSGDPNKRSIQTGESQWGMMSYLFRANYSFKDRYLVTLSGRADGSSRLAKGNQWALFPSAAIAWRASEEEFIKKLEIFSNLKARLSYGISGNQGVGAYAVYDKLARGRTVIGDQEVTTFIPTLSASKNLGWEKTKQIDIGFDMGFLDNRLSLEVDYYYKRTSDLLLAKELPYQTGYSSILENVGSTENKGWEFTLNSTNFDTQDFKWNTNLSLAFNRNKVLNLGGKEFLENGQGSRLIVGKPVGVFFGVKYLGTWKESEILEGVQHNPGDPKFEDLNEDGIIDVNDGQIIGSAEPKFYGGIGNDFTYKRLTLSLFFDFSYGNDIYDLSGRLMDTGFNANVYGRHRDRWTESNPDGYYPRAGSAYTHIYDTYAGGNTNGGNTLYVHDGSYLRLKNINLQYDIPLKNKRIIKSLQIYGTATNVFILTRYLGFSPDVDADASTSTRHGFDRNAYPQSKTYLLGVKASF